MMRKLHIRSIARKRNPYRQTQNRYGRIHTYPKRMCQNFKARRPNEKWGTDITYIRTRQGFVYLTIIKDFFDGTILGVVLQSDQGPQFQSAAYHTLTSELGIVPSMSRPGNCLDNAPTENFFSHLKGRVVETYLHP